MAQLPVRGVLSSDVNAISTTFLGRSVAGRSGPIWSMVARFSLVAAFLAVGLASAAFAPNRVGAQAFAGYPIAYCVVGAVVVWWAVPRIGGWVLHPLVDVNIALTAAMVYSSPSDLRATAPIASMPIGYSIGLADWTAGSTFEEAVQAADREMYADKRRKNR